MRSISIYFLIIFLILNAQAQYEYLSMTLNGMLGNHYYRSEKQERTLLGLEVGIPLTRFFQIDLGHNYTQDKTTYSDEYRKNVESLGYVLPKGKLEQMNSSLQTYINGSIGVVIGFVRPTVFGGALWQTVCEEDTFTDYGCQRLAMTWNAGVGIGAVLTRYIQLKAQYRISPNTLKTQNTELSIGLTWGI
jgi:hypothetical protein